MKLDRAGSAQARRVGHGRRRQGGWEEAAAPRGSASGLILLTSFAARLLIASVAGVPPAPARQRELAHPNLFGPLTALGACFFARKEKAREYQGWVEYEGLAGAAACGLRQGSPHDGQPALNHVSALLSSCHTHTHNTHTHSPYDRSMPGDLLGGYSFLTPRWRDCRASW